MNNHSNLLESIDTEVLDLAREHQEGRVSSDDTSVSTFDYLDRIEKRRKEGYTQEQIGEKLGWSRDKVARHVEVMNNTVTDVLDLARIHQKGRVTDDVTSVTFDYLDRIEKRRKEGYTQEQIGEKLGWSESKVKQYSALLNNVVTDVLDTAREHQEGRVTDEVTDVTFEFTEWWFRNSGLYEFETESNDDDENAWDELYTFTTSFRR